MEVEETKSQPLPVQLANEGTPSVPAETSASSSRQSHARRQPTPEPLSDILFRRLTVIKEGDNVLLKLPSDSIKAVVASKDGIVQLGKFGSFPASELLGLYYDITYEIFTRVDGKTSGLATEEAGVTEDGEKKETTVFGQNKGKSNKRKNNKGKEAILTDQSVKASNGWKNALRPLKKRPIIDSVIDDITETNEFIVDSEEARQSLLSQDEINELRAQDVSAEEMIQKQIERHEAFSLKTDFSKDKWLKRKEKKYLQTIHPLAPSTMNIVNHYATRSPTSILHLREDTLSQLLLLANIRPGGRYLVVDDTGGLVTAALIDRMGCEGRVLLFTDSDSPPGWGVLNVMNFGERELECVKWLNWMQADENYKRPPPPDEDELPATSISKKQARVRRHNAQVNEMNALRNELHTGSWDAIILATELSPISCIARLTPYLNGSGVLVVYSPYPQVIGECLQYCRKDVNYLATNMTESWTRTYQVLPGRTHPMMTTSATGGYLLHATRVFPSAFIPDSNQRFKRQRNTKKAAPNTPETRTTANAEGDSGDEGEIAEIGEYGR